jgi:hypothetical protein
MKTSIVRYFSVRKGATGPRYFWQPSNALRAAGWKLTKLSADHSAALIEAEKINIAVDEWRAGGPVTGGLLPAPALHAQRTVRENGLYVIRSASGSCKIGISKTPLRRVGQLHTGSNWKLELLFYFKSKLALPIERRAHAILATKRLNGEWFDVAGDIAVAAVMEAMRADFPAASPPDAAP